MSTRTLLLGLVALAFVACEGAQLTGARLRRRGGERPPLPQGAGATAIPCVLTKSHRGTATEFPCPSRPDACSGANQGTAWLRKRRHTDVCQQGGAAGLHQLAADAQERFMPR